MIGGGYWLTLPVPMLLALAMVGVSALVIRRTALGMLIESVGGNAEASRLAGVRWRGIIWLVYAFCGLTAGIAGLMISSNTQPPTATTRACGSSSTRSSPWCSAARCSPVAGSPSVAPSSVPC